MDPIGLTITASSVLFGFLFTGFWWALDRELKFEEKDRHFQPAYLLLFLTMLALAIFGILRPLSAAIAKAPLPSRTLLGLAGAFAGMFGYMVTALAHYSVFQYPKYKTGIESVLFGVFFLLQVVIFIIAVR